MSIYAVVGRRLGPDKREALYRALASEIVWVWQPGYRRDREAAYRVDIADLRRQCGGTYGFGGREPEQRVFLWLHYIRHRLATALDMAVARRRSVPAALDAAEWATRSDETLTAVVAATEPMARRIVGGLRPKQTDIEDWRQDAVLGLLAAISHYDATRGYRFSTFAYSCIIRRLIRRRKLDYQYADMQLRVLDEMQPESAYSARVSESLPGLLDLRDVLTRRPAVLTSRQRTVLARRYGLDGEPPETLAAIGAAMGATRERVRQIEAQAIQRLREVMLTDGGDCRAVGVG